MSSSLAVTAARRVLCSRRVQICPQITSRSISLQQGASPAQWNCSALVYQTNTTILRRPFSSIIENSSIDSSTPPPPPPPQSLNRRRKKKSTNDTTSQSSSTIEAQQLAPLTIDEYNPEQITTQIFTTAKWKINFHYEYVRLTVDDYERHLRYVLDHLQNSRDDSQQQDTTTTTSQTADQLLSNIHPNQQKCTATHHLLSPSVLSAAIRSLTRCKIDTPLLSQRIRAIEKLIGLIGWTPITEELSYRLLEANGKAGNVRRTLALLELRRRRGYVPREHDVRTFEEYNQDGSVNTTNSSGSGNGGGIVRGEKEFIQAIQSIKSAQLPLRRQRNIYLHESSYASNMDQEEGLQLDNPTRYLDAILLNMHQRNIKLRPEMATQMLSCYASTGRTGRAIHYFYKVVRDEIEEDGVYIKGPHPTHLGKDELEEWKESRRKEGMGVKIDGVESLDNSDDDDEEDGSKKKKKRTKPRMIMHPPPPFHKIPSHVEGASLVQNSDHQRPISFIKAPSWQTSSSQQQQSMNNTNNNRKTTKTKYEWEVDREWSLSLTAAFAFADSLTHGACGHDPIELNVGGWNCLIKACCYRGAFHRALKILNETMPQKGIEPDSVSYNTILAGLARVGDISSLKEYLMNMTNKRVPIDKYTVQAMADGFLNVGDISGASTMVQDIFNQHDTLPPYTTHLKIIEFALSNGLIFEAKRHVYFVQQLWKWEPSPHHDERFIEMMEATKNNPKLSKKALQKMFQYFSEELKEGDFF